MKAAAVSREGRWLALTSGEVLTVTFLDGTRVYEETTQTNRGRGFGECLFSADGSALWVVRYIGDGRLELQIRDTRTWQIRRQVVLSEPAPPTSFYLSAHPEYEIVVVWAAAGQDGQWVYWAYDDGDRIRVSEAPQLVETSPPEFHPSGSEFLVIREETLVRYSFPDCNEIGALQWPESDHGIGYSTCYVSDRNALVSSSEGRIYLVDLGTMCISDEIYVQGHEPRPCRELYPILNGEYHLCSDLQWFVRVGLNKVVAVHRELPAEDSTQENWRDVVVAWEQFPGFGDFTRADRTTPFSSKLIDS